MPSSASAAMVSCGHTAASNAFSCARSTGSSKAITATGLSALIAGSVLSFPGWRGFELDVQHTRAASAGVFDFMGLRLGPEHLAGFARPTDRGSVGGHRLRLEVRQHDREMSGMRV